MSSDANKETIAIKFTLKGKYDTSDTQVLWLTSQALLDEKATPEPHYPVLTAIRDVGVQQNEFFPKFSAGQIDINNKRDGLAFQKRITDLMCRYVIQGALVEVYVDCTDIKDNEFFNDANLIWAGEVQSVNYATDNKDSQRMSISIGQDQKDHVVTKKMTLGEFPALADRSNGKFLPIVLGFDQQVIPYAVSDPVATPLVSEQRFAYATNMNAIAGARFHNQGITKILVAEQTADNIRDPNYYPVTSVVTAISPAYLSIDAATDLVVNLGNPRAFWVRGFFPGTVVGTSHVVTGVQLTFQGNNNGVIVDDELAGEVSIRLHRKRLTAQRPAPPSETIAEAVIVKADYGALWHGPAIQFDVAAQFNKPVPVVGEQGDTYWFSIQASNEDSAMSVTHMPITNVAFLPGVPVGLVTHFRAPDETLEDNDDTWVEELAFGTAGQTLPLFRLYGFEFADAPAGDGSFDEQGLGYSYLDMRYNSLGSITPDALGQHVPDIDRQDIILEINGLSDFDGSVTGVPGFILGNPLTQIEALFHNFTGSLWLPGNFDDTRFTASHGQYINIGDPLFRETAGRTFNKKTNIEIIEQLARNSYSKVAYDGIGVNIGNYSLLAVGEPELEVFNISDMDAIVERWFVNRLDTVYNTLDMNYQRRLDNFHFQAERDQEDFKDYANTFRAHFRDGGIGQQYGAISAEHYGERRPDDENFDWIFTDESAAHVTELFLRLHDHPYEYAQVLVPYCQYAQLRMYDVGRVNSTELPSDWGTSPLVYEDKECGPAFDHMAKTKSLRCQIVAMTINFQESGPLQLRLLLRLITQINDPLYNIRGLT